MKQSAKNELLALSAIDAIKGFALRLLVLFVITTTVFLCLW